MTYPSKRCTQCHNPMTWAHQRVQYGRLLRLGLKPEHAKRLLPRCHKCITARLRDQPSPSSPAHPDPQWHR